MIGSNFYLLVVTIERFIKYVLYHYIMTTKDVKTKIGIYGTNFIVPSLSNFLQNAPKISEVTSKIPGLDVIASAANPWGALGFGALDLIGSISDKIKDSKFTRLAKVGGAAFYGVKTLMDLGSIAGGDYNSFIDLVFDGSMTYQLGKDTAENYSGRDLVDDLKFW